MVALKIGWASSSATFLVKSMVKGVVGAGLDGGAGSLVVQWVMES